MQVLGFNDRNELNAHFKQEGRSDKNTLYAVEGPGIIYRGSPGSDGFIGVANGFIKAFDGAKLFQLRATHGLPLGDAIQRITDAAYAIDWVGFIQEARVNGWWDFQTLEAVENAFIDADFDKLKADEILQRLKVWIVANPLVGVAS